MQNRAERRHSAGRVYTAAEVSCNSGNTLENAAAGGGEGMGAIEKTVDAVVDKVGAACQLVVICGRNKKLVEKLQQRSAFMAAIIAVQLFAIRSKIQESSVPSCWTNAPNFRNFQTVAADMLYEIDDWVGFGIEGLEDGCAEGSGFYGCRQYPEGMHVVINGFVDNMAEWMTACDTIVTKAGPGTIAESLICGLPLLLNGFVPCQEAGNVPFVIDHKVPYTRRSNLCNGHTANYLIRRAKAAVNMNAD